MVHFDINCQPITLRCSSKGPGRQKMRYRRQQKGGGSWFTDTEEMEIN
jgi:hypothetical protein